MADRKSKKNQTNPPVRQALAVQLCALIVLGVLAYSDVHANGELNISIYLYMGILTLAVGILPDAWVELVKWVIKTVFNRSEK